MPTRGSRISAVPDPATGTTTGTEAPSSPETVPAGGGRPSLPKRRPQENLAPQLADSPSSEGTGGPASGSQSTTPHALDSSERLERLRKNMSAFQKGTDRGRREGRQNTNDTDKDS